MSAIQSSIGLISGIPIQDTVDQLVSISARPRDALVSRNEGLTAERAAIDRLASLTLSTQFSLDSLDLRRTFDGRTVSSSDSSAVSVTAQPGATPSLGSYRFTPLRQASASQFVSDRVDDLSDLGTGSLSFQYGGQVDGALRLSQLNDGEGFDGGQIRITDQTGASAVIDLRGARTVDDVLDAINSATQIDVVASTDGGRFVLTDQTGGAGTLSVREVNNGAAAKELGILGEVDSGTGATLNGEQVYRLYAGSELSDLRDGVGVRITDEEGADANSILVTIGSDDPVTIDLSGSETLGDVIDKINAASDAQLEGALTAAIDADGTGLVLTNSSSPEALIVSNVGDGQLATQLGIATSSAGVTGDLAGNRLIGGLKDSLLQTLNAGAGFADGTADPLANGLGEIVITDRASASATIDLSSAETLGDVVALINASSVGVEASINEARNGVVIADTSGGDQSLVITNGASGTTADDLGIAINAAVDQVDSGSLGRQKIGLGTRLDALNGGRGVELSDLRITDAAGLASTINLDSPGDEAQTIGDVIDRINAAAIGVTASVNADGDGILLTDTTGGAGVLKVEESGSGTLAEQLGLLGESTTTDPSGQQTIDGSPVTTIDFSTLSDSPDGTLLSSLNGGDGVRLGIFQVTASDGASFTVDLGVSPTLTDAQTVGDVIDRINEAATEAGVSVTASLNSGQTGIQIVDSTGGIGDFTIEDLGTGRSAADLGLTADARAVSNSSDVEIVSGGLFEFDSDNALATLADRINQLDAGVTAAVFNDGVGFRLSLTAEETGSGADLLIDGLGVGLGFTQTSRAGDAVALFGGVGAFDGFAVTSSDNRFEEVVDGVTLEIENPTGDPVTINVENDDSAIVSGVQGFVDAYNSLQATLDDLTDFNAEAETTGILFGRGEPLRVSTDLSRLVTGRFSTGGGISTLQEVGISLSADGQLSFDVDRLRSALESSPADVESLFRDDLNGFVASFSEAIDRLAADENSVLGARSAALQQNIDSNADRIEELNTRLDIERDRLLIEFVTLEETLALLQSNNDFLASIQPIALQSNSS